jgi:hypothetical protein
LARGKEANVAEDALEAKFRELDELSGTLSQEEFMAKVEAELAPLLEQEMKAHGAMEPDWDPLEKVLPYGWCAGFMFMGYEGEIRIYKQGFTRFCIYIDERGNTYERHGKRFAKIPRRIAIRDVFEGIEDYGFKRSSPYNAKNAEKRRKRIERETGYKIMSIGGPR